jgi:hypothetical protein
MKLGSCLQSLEGANGDEIGTIENCPFMLTLSQRSERFFTVLIVAPQAFSERIDRWPE